MHRPEMEEGRKGKKWRMITAFVTKKAKEWIRRADSYRASPTNVPTTSDLAAEDVCSSWQGCKLTRLFGRLSKFPCGGKLTSCVDTGEKSPW